MRGEMSRPYSSGCRGMGKGAGLRRWKSSRMSRPCHRFTRSWAGDGEGGAQGHAYVSGLRTEEGQGEGTQAEVDFKGKVADVE